MASISVGFVHLHSHTVYSLLDGHSRISDIARKASETGMPAAAITDHGVMYGVVEFYKTCKEYGIKPIIGCEVYEAKRTRFDKEPKLDEDPFHLVLLAEDLEGYGNLVKIVSAAHLEGFYYKPRVDTELLRTYGKGLIALSGCLSGSIPRAILEGDYKGAVRRTLAYREIFGRENFFLEIQDNGLPDQKRVNRAILDISNETRTPVVATNDSHYTNREDARAHDVLLCIQTNKLFKDPSRLRFGTDEFYFRSPAEMSRLFSFAPEALDNTLAVAERCNVELEFNKPNLPRFRCPDGYTESTYLRKLCKERLAARYPEPSEEVSRRLEYELGVIEEMGYPGYFLIVSDFVEYARSRGIPVGPGRGSAAGSLVAYVLGITQVDPLKYGLLFERFLNPARVTLPDMDIDFCFERRGEVIEYVKQKYGAECVAQIITFGTMAARAVIRDVARTLDIPYAEADRLAKAVPAQLGITLDKALEVSPDLKKMYAEDDRYRDVIEIGKALEGIPRHSSVHAAGVVITGDRLSEFVPVQKAADGSVVTQFTMDVLEDLGLLKMDFLGLRTLTVLDKAIQAIRRLRGIEIDLSSLPLDDRKTYDMLAQGDTLGVFQLESDWVRDFLRNLKPRRFEDIIASVALCRPGPMEHIPEFIAARTGTPKYLHPRMEPILQETHGVMVYQEQIMQVASVMAGFSLAEADILRRAVGKKKKDLLDKMEQSFVSGCVEHGVSKRVAAEVYDLIMKFANYGFNKAHAASYGLIAYQTAYLKANYPVEFMAALLTSVAGAADKVAQYIDECRRLGIRVLPPDVNESLWDFTITKDGIRFGLSAVKNVGESAARCVIRAREEGGAFTSLRDFCSRVDPRALNRRVLESLIKSGAMGSLGKRAQLMEALDPVLAKSSKGPKTTGANQISLLGPAQAPVEPEALPDVPEYPRNQLLRMEKELLGLYISGNPLRECEKSLSRIATCTCAGLCELSDGDRVTLGGLVAGIRKVTTKNGEMMAFVTLEDLTGSVEVVVFPRVFSRVSQNVNPDTVVVVQGRAQVLEGQAKVVAEDISPLPDGGETATAARGKVTVVLKGATTDSRTLGLLKSILEDSGGPCPVYISLPDQKKLILTSSQYWVTPSPSLRRRLESAFGPGSMLLEEDSEEEFHPDESNA
ncbi:MAG: DNA polymerase III subunit alpha [Firmicutes bacterium]|jgi:DNA polymerase-3 subunit alpha|nr:DNA polymerase III subunit alpha [Bacillota bacterium]